MFVAIRRASFAGEQLRFGEMVEPAIVSRLTLAQGRLDETFPSAFMIAHCCSHALRFAV
jgi:hypothetical protein